MPKVSIIVPVYNVERYLEECVESLRNQTLQDIEIILVDDESPDNCPTMCDHYAQIDERIKVVHKNNEGLGFARNSGIELATGEYVAFTDSDDWESPETYEIVSRIADEEGGDVVYYSFADRLASTMGNKCFEGKEQINELQLSMVANSPESVLDRDIPVSSCLGLYRRNLLVDNNVKFHSERDLISEDLIFNIDVLLTANKVIVTNHHFYFYRVTTSSLTQTVRLDRFKKDKQFYIYLTSYLQDLGFGREGWLRSTRLFIGYSRSAILQMCKSQLPYNEKRKWTLEVCNDAIWRTVRRDYPIKQMRFKYRFFFYCMYKHLFFMIWIMSRKS